MWWAGDAPAVAPVWQAWLPTLLGVLVTAAGGIVGTVWVKRMNRRLDDATAAKTTAESRKADAETVSLEVATARSLISEIKAMMADQRAEFSARDSERAGQIKELVTQTSENREQLRALRASFASHSTWDADAVAALRQHLPSFPDPPPVNFD
jgi:muconolactone delta-isomerase/predicted outer membrane lipoprotein